MKHITCYLLTMVCFATISCMEPYPSQESLDSDSDGLSRGSVVTHQGGFDEVYYNSQINGDLAEEEAVRQAMEKSRLARSSTPQALSISYPPVLKPKPIRARGWRPTKPSKSMQQKIAKLDRLRQEHSSGTPKMVSSTNSRMRFPAEEKRARLKVRRKKEVDSPEEAEKKKQIRKAKRQYVLAALANPEAFESAFS